MAENGDSQAGRRAAAGEVTLRDLDGLLPPGQAFAVQFNGVRGPGGRPCLGRIEHLASKAATYFDSLDEMLTFMEDMMVRTGGNDSAPPSVQWDEC
jgi:hypothetical protein